MVPGGWETAQYHMADVFKDHPTSFSGFELREAVRMVLNDIPNVKIPCPSVDDLPVTGIKPETNPGGYWSNVSCNKADTLPSVFPLAQRLWEGISNGTILSDPGHYTVGARGKRVKWGDHFYFWHWGITGTMCKTRVVMMPDYVSQLAQQPWAESLMSHLRFNSSHPDSWIRVGWSANNLGFTDLDICHRSGFSVESDWTAFDAGVSSELIHASFAILFDMFEESPIRDNFAKF